MKIKYKLLLSFYFIFSVGSPKEKSKDFPKYVRWAKIRIMKHNACSIFGYQSPDMICGGTTEKDTCNGDSGGPLACIQNQTMILAGITSFGVGCAWEHPNAGRIPGIYMRITSYLDWLSKHREKRPYSPLRCWKLNRRGDGHCDARNNYAECEYDGGDCD